MDVLMVESLPRIVALKDRAFRARDAYRRWCEMGAWASEAPEAGKLADEEDRRFAELHAARECARAV